MSDAIPDKVDVLIAGAGPAGLAAGIVLSKSGARVLLADCRRRIGHPLRCAGLSSMEFFDDLGASPRNEWVLWKLPRTGNIVIDRPAMEANLAWSLSKQGVEVFSGASVMKVSGFDGGRRTATVLHKGRKCSVSASCIIAADGAASVTARSAGLAPRLRLEKTGACLARHIRGADCPHWDSIFIAPVPGYPCPPYYFWVIPRGRDELSVGLGVPGLDGSKAPFLLDRVIHEIRPFTGGRVVETVAGLLPGQGPLGRLHDDGIMAVGTAAGMVHPEGGHGLRYAAKSGRIAGETAAGLSGAPALAERLAAYEAGVAPLVDELKSVYERIGPAMEAREAARLTP